jgi:mRNA interferase HicA
MQNLLRVKRKALIKHLADNDVMLLREGLGQSIYQRGKYRTEVPRHNETIDELARKICRDLDIPLIK